ncbi:MAG: hypothetical protein QN198_02290 [Armatimonadota bacterium]|nr:hypothetical protein [Armatimonadota bacterium]MDR5702415.1 hypothetical protein [Armatimonadota bacterium]MDR7435609.1 hypothetical protein [Armatimonadota bacterium]
MGKFWAAHLRLPVLAGFGAGFFLLLFYLAIIGLSSRSWSHLTEQFSQDKFFIIALASGFGIQAGLFTYIKKGMMGVRGTSPSLAVASAGTATSTASMVACCLHHLSDVLPFLGLSGAVVFLTEYKIPLILIGIGSNLVGIALMVRIIRRARAMACHVA